MDCPNNDARFERAGTSHFFGKLGTPTVESHEEKSGTGLMSGVAPESRVSGGRDGEVATLCCGGGVARVVVDDADDDEERDGDGICCCLSNPLETMRSHLRLSWRSSASCTASWDRNSRHLDSFWAIKWRRSACFSVKVSGSRFLRSTSLYDMVDWRRGGGDGDDGGSDWVSLRRCKGRVPEVILRE